MTYAGSRSYDLEGELRRLQRAVGGVPGAVRRHAGRQPHRSATSWSPNPFFGVAGLRGHDAVHEPDALAVRAEPAVPGVHRHHPEPEQHRQADLRLGAVRRQQALGEGRHHQRQLHVGAAVDRDRREHYDRHRQRYVDEVSLLRTTGPYFSQRKHRVTASGVWELPWFRNQRASPATCSAAGRSRRCSSSSRGQPWDMPGNVDLAPGVDLKDIALAGREGRAVHLRRQAVRRPAQRDDGQLRSAVGLDGVRLHRAVLPDPRELPAPHGDVPLRRVPPAGVLAGRRELREDDADHRQAFGSRSVSRRSTSSTARCTTSGSTTRPRRRRTSAASTATPPVSRTSSASSSWGSG